MTAKNQQTPDTVQLVHSTKGTRIRVAVDHLQRYLRDGYKLRDGATRSAPRAASALPDGDPSESWTVAQLNAYAEANVIDLAGATRKADILAAIAATADPDNFGGGDGDEDQDDEDDDVDLDGQDDDETE